MYSKCIVEPLIKHPIAITASKGLVEAPPSLDLGPSALGVVGEAVSINERRFAEEAMRDGAALADWTLAPSISFCEAKGSSYDPGTVLTTMFSRLTPWDWSLEIVPETREEMTASFHLAWTMAIRNGDPSYDLGGGGRPLIVGSDMARVCCEICC